jgi:hypothetical protein
MHQTVELVLKSYMPKQLEIGMWFITKINPGTRKEYTEVWALDKFPRETFEEFIVIHGAPVEPYLIYDEQVLAEPHEIGWWDEGDHIDELRDVELSDINFLLTEWDGYVDVEIDEWDYAHEEEINPILYSGKITMTIPGMYEEEYEDEDDDDDDEGPWLCGHCNGSGYGSTPDTACPVCKGEGELYDDDDEEDDETDMDDDS